MSYLQVKALPTHFIAAFIATSSLCSQLLTHMTYVQTQMMEQSDRTLSITASIGSVLQPVAQT